MTATVWPSPDRSRLVDVGGFRVFVTDVGPDHALPLVLVHDVLTCGHAFARVLDQLPADRRYLVVDLPGCGESDRPEPARIEHHRIERLAQSVGDVLHRAEIARYEVLGQGFGALVAMALASARPGDVAGVIASGVSLGAMQLGHELRLAGLPAIGNLAFARAYRRADLERTLGRWRAAPQTLDALAVDVYWDRLGREGGMAAARDMLLQLERAPLVGEAFASSGVPAVLVWGDRDVVGEADRARWSEILPAARSIVLEGCGHAAVEDRPAAFVEALATLAGGPCLPA